MTRSFYIIDGHSYSYQAFYAIKSLRSPSGVPTNAIFGFVKFINKLIGDKRPDYLAVCFDSAAPTFRHEYYQKYKANRPQMPEDMQLQLPVIQRVLQAYQIPVFAREGFEADDLLISIAVQAAQQDQDVEIFLLSPDKDIGQIVNERIKIYDNKKNQIIDSQGIREIFKVMPQQLPDYFALVGDSVDNIPGVKGVGPKKASELLQQWSSLEEMYANLEAIQPEKTRKLLQQHRQEAFLSKKLFQADSSVDLCFQLEKCKTTCGDRSQIIALFRELGFRSLLSDLQQDQPPVTAADLNLTVNIINSDRQLAGLVKRLAGVDELVILAITAGDSLWQTRIEGVALAWHQDQSAYISVNHELPLAKINERLEPLIHGGPVKITHDSKKLLQAFAVSGLSLYPLGFDTTLAAYLVACSDKEASLDDLILEYLGLAVPQVPPHNSAIYCIRAHLLDKVTQMLRQSLQEKQLLSLLVDVELPLVPVIVEMELTGMHVDSAILEDIARQAKQKLQEVEGQIYRHAGVPFNISSSRQLAKILFEKLGLPTGKKNKSGYSTSVNVLEELKNQHEIVALILKFRHLSKLISTYIEVLPQMIDQQTRRVHTSFHQAKTATGRLASSRPNLQNIPVGDAEGSQIRQAFIAGEDNLLIAADYSQIELRILADLSQDPLLLAAFADDVDIHTTVAASLFAVSASEVSYAQRQLAKAVNYGIIYGQTPFGLAQELAIPIKQAKKFIEAYFARHARVKDFLAELVEEASQRRYVTTILARRRYLPDIASSNHQVRKFAERVAVNTVMQGSAADIIKKAMIAIYRRRNEDMLNCKFLLQVHDELIFETPIAGVETIVALVKEEMSNAVSLSVPLKVNIATGGNWQQVTHSC